MTHYEKKFYAEWIKQYKDSLCNVSISSLNQAVAIKDQLVICKPELRKACMTYRKRISKDKMQLANDLNTALKANRKSDLKNKALTCGLMIMTGITTSPHLLNLNNDKEKKTSFHRNISNLSDVFPAKTAEKMIKIPM